MEHIWHNICRLLTYDASAPMLFSSGTFWALFLVFMPLYGLLKRRWWQMAFFVVAFSFFFYYKSSGLFVAMLAGTSLLDWWLSRLMARPGMSKGRRKACVALSLTVSLGILAYFKYANFFLWNIQAMVGGNFQPLDLVLPVGISFYTFQSVSYIIDVYKGRVAPTETWLEYAFFLSFFPALVAGPIVRADYFLPQIRANASATRTEVYAGLWMIILGVVKKAIIADYIAQYNDLIFQTPGGYSGFETLMGIIGYTMQIYCDFSGYSDMAIGLALLMGYRFKINFAAPFKSQSPTEFWRRWHISLSTWLRDYIYIPLGGNRKGRVRKHLNLFITMTVGGLWHGASWMYLIWGAYHGLLLIVHKELSKVWRIPESLKGRPEVKAANIMLTFALVVAGFTIFRAPSLEVAGQIATQIFTAFHPEVITQFVEGYMLIVLALAAGYLAHISPRRWTTGASAVYTAMPAVWQAMILAAIIFLVVQTRQSELVPFIYLQY